MSSYPVDNATPQVLTFNRETDARTALTRGLAEWLATRRITSTDGRPFQLNKVYSTWAEPEDAVRSEQQERSYPLGVVYAVGKGMYDDSKMTPSTVQPLADDLRVLQTSSEYVLSLQLELWSNDPNARMWFSVMLEDEFSPDDSRSGVRLVLPHYFGVHADYVLMDSEYADNEQDATRRFRKVIATVEGRIPVTRVRTFPAAIPMRSVSVDGLGVFE